jgi:hypothetical protein
MQTKRFTATLLAGLLLAGTLSVGGSSFTPANAELLKGNVIQTDRSPNATPTLNEDDIKTVTPGTTLDMVISTAVTPGVNVSGDEFFGKVSKDYTVDGKVVIPKDTIVHGVVEQMSGPKRAGRNGYINTRFDYLITPDGREISIEGNNTTRDSKVKAAAKVVGRASGYTAVGGVVGAVMVLRYGGLAAVAASNGYALAGGAAVGGVAGLTAAMLTKGHSAMLQPGAEIRIKLAEELHLPTMNMPDATADDYTLEGLGVKVLGLRYDKDPFGEPVEVNVTLDISNKTENTFSTFEIGLEDEYGNVFFPSPFGDTGMWFSKITPNSKITSNLTFNVDNTKLKHKLVFFKPYTREPLAKFALVDKMIIDKKQAKKLDKQISSHSN